MPSNHRILCCLLLLLPSIFPSIRVFSNESALHIRWSKYWRFSFSISSSNEYSGLISLVLTSLISLQSKGFSRVFSNTTVQKHQFFGIQPSLWPSSHTHYIDIYLWLAIVLRWVVTSFLFPRIPVCSCFCQMYMTRNNMHHFQDRSYTQLIGLLYVLFFFICLTTCKGPPRNKDWQSHKLQMPCGRPLAKPEVYGQHTKSVSIMWSTLVAQSCLTLCDTSRPLPAMNCAACQALLSMESSRQECQKE